MTVLARLPKQSDSRADEIYAFLEVVAPKLEQLRRRLSASKLLLNQGDPDQGRLDAIIESQLAFKEFLSGIANLSGLVEPIDVLLEALNQESAALQTAEAEQAPVAEPVTPVVIVRVVAEPEPAPEPEPVVVVAAAQPVASVVAQPVAPPAPIAPVIATPIAPALVSNASPQGEGWLQIGTVIAVEKLTKAGMPAAGAEAYIERLYADVGLTQTDGRPILVDDVKGWRAKVLGRASSAWRRNQVGKARTAGLGKPQPTLADITARVDELAHIFKKMTQTAL